MPRNLMRHEAGEAGPLAGGLSEHFQDLEQSFDQASRNAGGIIEHTYSIAGWPVRLRFAGPALVARVAPAFAHLSGDRAEPALTVCLWDGASTGARLPPTGWMPSEGYSGRVRDDGPLRFRAAFQPLEQALSFLDARRDLAFYVIGDAAGLPYYESSTPLRFILHWWMAGRGLHLVHAGAVGTRSGGVLLIGKGGSGKSTAALACLGSGLAYAGDDHVLISTDPSPHVYSLYNSGKLHSGHIQRFPHLLPKVWNGDRGATDKAVIFLHQFDPDQVSAGFPVRAVLIPRVGDRADSSTEEVSAGAALRALGPSTIFGLPGAGAASLGTIARLLRQLPSYALILGSDVAGIAPVIARLLSQLPRGVNGPLVSVIVPVYNSERFLEAALQSIFAQDYHPVEVIVVDDGSDDGTGGIAQSFDEVRYIRQDNQGPAAARNAGIAAATGEFLTFHDADDLMAPNKLSAQVSYLLTDPEVDCVLARQEVFFEPGVEQPDWLKRDRVFGDLGGVQPLSAMVRRIVMERVGGFDPTYRISEDTDWLFRVRAAGVGIAVLPEILLYRRIHRANVSYQRVPMGQTWLRSLKSKIDRERRRKEPGGEEGD